MFPSRRDRRGPIALAALAAAAIAAPTLAAQPEPDNRVRPAAAGRIVKAYDFEERDTNPLPIPRGWVRAQHDPGVPRDRPGFPIWNQAELDYSAPAFRGIGSVRLPTEGGSTSLTTRPAELSVFADADYMLSVRLRTEGLNHAGARLVAALLDQKGDEIQGTRRTTPVTRTDGTWELLTLLLEGADADAAFVQVEFQLLQPEQQPRRRHPGPFHIWDQDYAGDAYFDDLVIAQIPMIELATNEPANIVPAGSQPQLRMRVRDLTGDRLVTRITVRDARGVVVDEFLARHGSSSLRESWTPDLPSQGWYQAELQVLAGQSLVGSKSLDFAWIPLREDPAPSIFRLAVTEPDPRVLSALTRLTQAADVSGLDLTVMTADTKPNDLLYTPALTEQIDTLIARGLDLSMGFGHMPFDLADQAALDQDAVAELLISRRDVARDALGPLMDRYGQVVHHWRVGAAGTEDDPAQLNAAIAGLAEAFDPYVPGAVVGLSWPMDRAFQPQAVRHRTMLSVIDNPAMPERAYDQLMSTYDDGLDPVDETNTNQSAHDTAPALAVRLAPRHEHPRRIDARDRAGWLARRAVNAWWAIKSHAPGPGARAVTLEDPWTNEPGKRGRVMPDPELVVFSTLARELGTRDAIEELTLAPGVRMLLCSAPQGPEAPDNAAVVIWSEDPSAEGATLTLPLSTNPVRVVGMFGRERTVPVTRITDLELPRHEITVTREPQIITGVNPELMRFLNAIRLSPARLEAAPGVHDHTLRVTNPWKVPIRGKVYIVEPGGYTTPDRRIDRSWEIEPRVVTFAIEPESESAEDIAISFSPGQLAGPLDVVYDIELDADRVYPLMRITQPITLESDKIRLDLRRTTDPATGMSAVSAYVTNTSDDPMLVELSAIATRHPRQESTISAIDPGARVERLFVFADLAKGDEVIVSAKSDAHSVKLNQRLAIP